MGSNILDILRDFILPIATLILGWLVNAYRNKQQKEKNILDNVQQILDMKTQEVERARIEVDRAHTINDRQEATLHRLEEKLDKKDKAIRKSRRCDWVLKGNECPVVDAEERYFHYCEGCNSKEVKDDSSKDSNRG